MAYTDQKVLNAISWFEIPVTDMPRAVHFYEQVFGIKLELHANGDHKMAWFPMHDGIGAAGSLVLHPEFYRPSKDGVLIYFSSPSGDLSNELIRIDPAGGRVVVPKESIGEHGFIAIFLDTEGNRVALHSRK